MSHAILLDAIRDRDPGAALEMLEQDPALCTTADSPSALMLALYHAQFHLADAIHARRERLSVWEAAAIGDDDELGRILGESPELATGRADDDFTPLHLACFFGREAAARLLLAAGAEADATGGPNGLRPLHSAAANGSVPICEMLIARGVDVNARQAGSFTPLHAAAGGGNVALVELLLKEGADRALRTDNDRSGEDLARDAGHPTLAERLSARD